MAKQGFQFDLAPIIAALKNVDDAVRDKLVKEALSSGATIIEHAVVTAAPTDRGALRESIGIKIVATKGSGTGVAIIGPRTDFGTVTQVPYRYAHLVELGHVNGDGSFTPGNPFIKRATDATRGAALAAVSSTLNAGIAAAGGGA